MQQSLKAQLLKIAKNKQTKSDPSHDVQHVLRVFNLANAIGRAERADLDILVPAALFHDSVVYQKNSHQSKNESDESAAFAVRTLRRFKQYPKEKVEKVAACIRECSFSKGTAPSSLESKVLQDADRLEATGAISIMRTFSSGGQMGRPFYDPADPFCKKGTIAFRSDLDLFYRRLLVVEQRMHTPFAKKIARRRTLFLRQFLRELRLELKESKVIK